MSRKSPNSKAKAALKEAVDRLLAACNAPAQHKACWSVESDRLIYQTSSPTARKALNEALRLALQRHQGLFLQEPVLKKTQIVFDGTSLSLTLLHAIVAESLGLLLDEIDDWAEGQKPLSSKQFLSALNAAVKKHSLRWVKGERKWVQALDGILSEEEFEFATRKCLEKQMKQKEQQLQKLLKRVTGKEKKLASEIERVWDQSKDLGPEAKETIWIELLDPRINALKKRLA